MAQAEGEAPSEISRRGLMLVLSSPSGAGKTSISRALLDRDPNLSLSISVTTRPKRPGEVAKRDYEFVELAAEVDAGRRLALEVATDTLEEAGQGLLGSDVRFEYRPGWKDGVELLEALESGIERDLQQGSTQAGPHRADLKLIYDERQARKLVSRGQQKLLACAMILAAAETAQAALERPLLLLLEQGAPPGCRILDLGCGNGALCDRLSRLGYPVVGVDPSASGMAAAKRMFPGISFHQASATIQEMESLALAPFDVVISTEVG